MSIGLSSTSTQVTVALSSPSSNQSLVSATSVNQVWNANTPQTLRTVTAGKTFYVLGFSVFAGVGACADWKLKISGGATKLVCCAGATVAGVLQGSSPLCTFNAGEAVAAESSVGWNAANYVNISVWGYEA